MYRLTVHVDGVKRVDREVKVGKEKKIKSYIYNTISIRNIPNMFEVNRRLADMRDRYTIKQKNGKEMYNIAFQ